MANKDDKVSDNVSGAWYVDSTCILCGVCVSTAPNNFNESSDGLHDRVYKQPENDDEIAQCKDAQSQCPVSCIGDDGE